MKVADILSAKGSNKVMTVRPNETIVMLANRLRMEHVGAMIVSQDGKIIDGIISERDVTNGVAVHGADLLNLHVSDLMTRGVITCSPSDTIADIAKVMTRDRVRHLPVEENGELIGIVSVGDVVKFRIAEMELEANVLRDYAIARG
jgi:signal-transduction protein with cAMP-binding, CBS, and nucleotidyltransferase domain